MSQPFRADVEAIRARARVNMERGAITEAYGLQPGHVIHALNDVLATEIVCMLRYKCNYLITKDIHAETAAEIFLEHAHQEQEHIDAVAERIIQLGGWPNMNPEGLAARSYAQYTDGSDVRALLRENLVAERIAIEIYTELIRWLSHHDPGTRRMMENILRTEETHAHELITSLDHRPVGPLERSRGVASSARRDEAVGRAPTTE